MIDRIRVCFFFSCRRQYRRNRSWWSVDGWRRWCSTPIQWICTPSPGAASLPNALTPRPHGKWFFSLTFSFSLLSAFPFLTLSIPSTIPSSRGRTRRNDQSRMTRLLVPPESLSWKRRLWNFLIDTRISLLLGFSLCRWTCESDEKVDRLKPKRAT